MLPGSDANEDPPLFTLFRDVVFVHFNQRTGLEIRTSVALLFDEGAGGVVVGVLDPGEWGGGSEWLRAIEDAIGRYYAISEGGVGIHGNRRVTLQTIDFAEDVDGLTGRAPMGQPGHGHRGGPIVASPLNPSRPTDDSRKVDWSGGMVLVNETQQAGGGGRRLIGMYERGTWTSGPGSGGVHARTEQRVVKLEAHRLSAVGGDVWTPLRDVCRALAGGEAVVVLDDTSRENEGDIIIASQFANTSNISFMVRYTSGVITVPILPRRAEDLGLPLMVPDNRSNESHGTKFTVSVDKLDGTTTGISSEDRALTIRALADFEAGPSEFRKPGHVFPLVYREGGVLERQGHTETSIDLCKLSGLLPCAAICEITRDDGMMMRRPETLAFAKRHGLAITTVGHVVEHVRRYGMGCIVGEKGS